MQKKFLSVFMGVDVFVGFRKCKFFICNCKNTSFFLHFICCQSSMHEAVPSVVAMAVRMVMAMCRIFCQIVFVFMCLSCVG